MKQKEYLKYLDKNESERVRLKIRTDKGKILDIVVQYESEVEGHWKPMVRYDCAHGFFHRDIILPDGSKEKKALAIHDLETALSYAEQDIKDRWEFYKSNYLKHIKR